ncbi:MAG: histidinol-phosphate transaminase, partial [Sphingomonadales bacterium]|nr:histidinol-phosphate transaminase [Sphingomonadales bacterium]
MSVLDLIRADLKAHFKPYSSSRTEAGMTADVVRIDANESPLSALPSEPLVEGLNRYPDPQPLALVARLAAFYGINTDRLLVTRGSDEGIDLLIRAFCEAGRDKILTSPPTFGFYETAALLQGAAVETVPLAESGAADVKAMEQAVLADDKIKLVFLCTPNNPTGAAVSCDEVISLANALKDRALLVVDEAYAEFSSTPSAATLDTPDNLVVLRTLSKAFAMAGARVGSLIAVPELITFMRGVLAPYPVPEPVTRAALKALSPTAIRLMEERVKDALNERARMADALAGADGVTRIYESEANFLLVEVADLDAIKSRLEAYGIVARYRADLSAVRLSISTVDDNNAVLAAFGVAVDGKADRTGEVVRVTNETGIMVRLDLDKTGTNSIDTGIGFFDHMLDQVASHGGFALTLECKGDLEIDAHHSVEDSMIALGQALSKALGTRRGIKRFGFVLPMDETEAQVSIDLGGRAYSKFEGDIPGEMVGDFPVEMTSHAFQSLAGALKASIHVKVEGENAHHMIEACFKALGRAL